VRTVTSLEAPLGLDLLHLTVLRRSRNACAHVITPNPYPADPHRIPNSNPACRGFAAHSLLHQLSDEEPTVVAELVALITDLEPEDGVTGVRASPGSGLA
jgi:hypothetical protein